MSEDDQTTLRPEPGDQVVVLTPDRRAYYGRLLEVRESPDNAQAVVRLDTGWVTSFPMHMVHMADTTPTDSPGAQA